MKANFQRHFYKIKRGSEQIPEMREKWEKRISTKANM